MHGYLVYLCHFTWYMTFPVNETKSIFKNKIQYSIWCSFWMRSCAYWMINVSLGLSIGASVHCTCSKLQFCMLWWVTKTEFIILYDRNLTNAFEDLSHRLDRSSYHRLSPTCLITLNRWSKLWEHPSSLDTGSVRYRYSCVSLWHNRNLLLIESIVIDLNYKEIMNKMK